MNPNVLTVRTLRHLDSVSIATGIAVGSMGRTIIVASPSWIDTWINFQRQISIIVLAPVISPRFSDSNISTLYLGCLSSSLHMPARAPSKWYQTTALRLIDLPVTEIAVTTDNDDIQIALLADNEMMIRDLTFVL